MLFIEDFSDRRLQSWCIHCGKEISGTASNNDHVPTQAFLSKPMRRKGAEWDIGVGENSDYLPQVHICKHCNSSFARDENYFLCVLHAVMAGTLYPDPVSQKEAYNVLRSNRKVVRELRDSPNGWLFENQRPFIIYPDTDRISNVIIKNARGHVYHELAEGLITDPDRCTFTPLQEMNEAKRDLFERSAQGELSAWPELGSRMMERIATCQDIEDGWIFVERSRYRYSLNWNNGITVKTVIWEYLATETHWPD